MPVHRHRKFASTLKHPQLVKPFKQPLQANPHSTDASEKEEVYSRDMNEYSKYSRDMNEYASFLHVRFNSNK